MFVQYQKHTRLSIIRRARTFKLATSTPNTSFGRLQNGIFFSTGKSTYWPKLEKKLFDITDFLLESDFQKKFYKMDHSLIILMLSDTSLPKEQTRLMKPHNKLVKSSI